MSSPASSESVAGWVLGVVAVSAVVVGGCIALLWARDHRVAKARMPELTAAMHLGFVPWLASVAADHLVRKSPCVLHVWQLYFVQCLFVLVFIAKAFILYMKTEYVHKCIQAWEAQNANSDLHAGESSRNDHYAHVVKTKKLLNKQIFGLYFFVACLMEAFPSMIGTILNWGLWSSDGMKSCQYPVPGIGTIALGFMNIGVLLWLSRNMRDSLDSFGIRKELNSISVVLLVCSSSFVVFVVTKNFGSRFPLKTLTGMIAIVSSSIISCYIPFFESLKESKMIESDVSTVASVSSTKRSASPIIEFIKRFKDGYPSLLNFLKGEYCSENLLFIIDCESFFDLMEEKEMETNEHKMKFAFRLAKKIHSNYLTDESPMQVNLSFANMQQCNTLKTLFRNLSESLTIAHMKSIEAVFLKSRAEVLDVLHKDAWRRFRLTARYRKIIRRAQSQEFNEKLLVQVIQTGPFEVQKVNKDVL